jgi:inner membrane transporter RhtA
MGLVGGRIANRAVPPQILVLVGIASVQFGSAFANKLFDRAGPGGTVFLRVAFGAILLLAIARPRFTGRSRRDWYAAAAFGIVLAGMNWSFYEALSRMPLGPAVTIEFVGPLAVAVAGSRKLLDLVWVVLAGGGVALLSLGKSSTSSVNPTGVLFALLAGSFWACYILISQHVGATFSGLDGLALALTVGGVLLIPVGIGQGGSALLNPAVLAGGLGVALLSSVIPYSLELNALRRMAAATFGLLMSLEPAVAALAGVIVLGQHLKLRTMIALVMVIAASVGTTLESRRRSQQLPP